MVENLFLSVGAMKAGTTWLYTQLKDHPEIYFTPEKEIHYFANIVGIENQLNRKNRILKLRKVMQKFAAGNPYYIGQNIDEIYWYSLYAHAKNINNVWYESLFTLKKEQKFCADFSNLYSHMDINGWANVKKVSNNVKVIYTLRDPTERLWSHYKFHMKWVKREDEALDAGFGHFKALLDKPWFFINAEYAKNYRSLRQSLNADELMLLYFEDFREDPAKMLRKVQNFLGIKTLEPEKEKLEKRVNKTKDFELPDEWLEYMQKKLQPLYKEMQNDGIWHEKWGSLNV